LLEEGGADLHALGAGHDGLDGVGAGVDAAGDGDRAVDVGADDGGPAEPQGQLGGVGEVELGDAVEGLEVDVGLVEAVEEDQPVEAEVVEAAADVGQGAEEGGELDGDGDGDDLLDVARDVEDALLDLGAGLVGVGADVVDVELQGVGAGLGDL